MSDNAQPSPVITELAVSGMTCNNCARKVTNIIQGFPGVASASLSLEHERASIRWHEETHPDLPQLLAALEAAGYAARAIDADAPASRSPLGGWAVNLLLGIPVTLVLMACEWIFRLGDARWFGWAAFALALPVQIFAGARFYRGAWAQLKARSSSMDTLVALGSTTAFGYSAWALLAGWSGHLYFMEAAAIITLISVGHWLEARIGEKAAGSLKALMTLAPQTARRLEPDRSSRREEAPSGAFNLLRSNFHSGQSRLTSAAATELVETEVPVSQLRIGDRVVLRPGDRVPVDGEVIEGDSAVDESMLTGESRPINKSTHSTLYTGTTNLNGRLVMRVTATGEATALDRKSTRLNSSHRT